VRLIGTVNLPRLHEWGSVTARASSIKLVIKFEADSRKSKRREIKIRNYPRKATTAYLQPACLSRKNLSSIQVTISLIRNSPNVLEAAGKGTVILAELSNEIKREAKWIASNRYIAVPPHDPVDHGHQVVSPAPRRRRCLPVRGLSRAPSSQTQATHSARTRTAGSPAGTRCTPEKEKGSRAYMRGRDGLFVPRNGTSKD
jgi:hypothetical protein